MIAREFPITPEQRQRVKDEVARRLDKAMDNQGTVNPRGIAENGLPVYLALLFVLDVILDGNRRVDIVIPVRSANVLDPYIEKEKPKCEFRYKEIIENISSNGTTNLQLSEK